MAIQTAKMLMFMASLLLGACSSNEPPMDFLDEDLTGQIAGKEWNFLYGFIDPTIDTPEEDDLVIVLLPFKPKGRCPKEQSKAKDRRSVMVSIPLDKKKVIKLKSGSNRNAVFQYTDGGKQAATVVKSGKVKLDTIGAKKISGRLFAKHSDTNWVSGKFSAVVCEYADFK